MTYKEIENLFNSSGLFAEFRIDSQISWSDVVSRSQKVPYYYTLHEVDYQTVHFCDASESAIDISMILYHDRKPCGVWPLVFDREEKEPVKSINNQYGGVVLPPLFIKDFPKKSQRKVVKSCIDFLNLLVESSKGDCWRTNESSLDGDISQWYQIALEQGATLDKVSYELHLDLTMSIEEIRKNIRKSYRPLISSGQKKWKTLVMDEYSEEVWNKFKALHKKVAGRVTRSIETWNIQHQAIKDGNAFLVYILDSKQNMVGAACFIMSDYQCNYSVATYDKSLLDQPLGHMIQYQAILTMKDKGRETYYIGDRFYKLNLPYVSEKQVQISHFKQGFSSLIFPRIGLIFKMDGDS